MTDRLCSPGAILRVSIVAMAIMTILFSSRASAQSVADARLPTTTIETKPADLSRRVIIDITSSRAPGGKDAIWIDGKAKTFRGLFDFLATKGNAHKRNQTPSNPGLSRTGLLIRCDADQAFGYIFGIMLMCADPKVGIHDLHFGVRGGRAVAMPLPTRRLRARRIARIRSFQASVDEEQRPICHRSTEWLFETFESGRSDGFEQGRRAHEEAPGGQAVGPEDEGFRLPGSRDADARSDDHSRQYLGCRGRLRGFRGGG